MLKYDIGVNAGVIWHLLLGSGALSVIEIAELTGYREKMIMLSLGWLAREDKIRFLEDNKVELIPIFPEIYF
jgi:hypothetical protein